MSCFAPLPPAFAQPLIQNPSFEADTTSPPPGYGTITGWTYGSPDVGYGINEAGGPFADNGAVPDGSHVAFIQDNGTLNQAVSGFIPGERYWLVYRENARGLCCGEREATLTVRVDGITIVPTHTVPIAGGTNPYRLVTSPSFIPSEPNVLLSFEKGGFGDSTALIDDLRVLSEESIRLIIALTNGFTPVIEAYGIPGRSVQIEFKNVLKAEAPWRTLTNLVLEGSPIRTVDLAASNDAPRFYRLRQAP